MSSNDSKSNHFSHKWPIIIIQTGFIQTYDPFNICNLCHLSTAFHVALYHTCQTQLEHDAFYVMMSFRRTHETHALVHVLNTNTSQHSYAAFYVMMSFRHLIDNNNNNITNMYRAGSIKSAHWH